MYYVQKYMVCLLELANLTSGLISRSSLMSSFVKYQHDFGDTKSVKHYIQNFTPII